MPRVVITRIEVTNCGPWSGHHVFEIPPEGIAVLVAPNESGKTTLLRAVAAILWGYNVPERNWYAPANAPHCGTLYFCRLAGDDPASRGDSRYRVFRDFGTAEVKAQALGEGGKWYDLRHGRHRERSRTPDKESWSKEFVAKYFAPISARAFCHVAMLSQPWPHQLNPELIQEFIVGIGEATIEKVRENLVSRYRRISCFSKAAGLHTHDGKTPGQLDEISDKIRLLEEKIARRDRLVEGLENIRGQLADVEAKLRRLENERDLAVRQRDALDKARELCRQLALAEESAKHLERSVNRLQQLQDRLTEYRAEADKWPKPLGSAGTKELEGLRDMLARWGQQRAALPSQEELLEERKKIEAESSSVAHFPPNASAAIEQYLNCLAETERLRQEVSQHESKVAELSPRLDRRRQQAVAIAAGLGTGFLVLVLLLAMMSAAGLVSSVSGALFGGLFCALVSAGIGAGVGWLIPRVYKPMVTSPGYEQALGELEGARSRLQAAEVNLKMVSAGVAFAGTSDSAELARLAERFRSYQARLDQWRERFSRRQELERELDPSRLPGPLQTLLSLHGGSPELAEKALNELTKLRQQIEKCEEEIATILRSFDCTEPAHLESRRAAAVDRRQNLRKDLDELAHSYRTVAEFLSDPPDVADRKYHELVDKINRIEEAVGRLGQERESLRASQARLEAAIEEFADLNVAKAEEELRLLKLQVEKLRIQGEAIRAAFEILTKAERAFSEVHCQALEDRINSLMHCWTARKERFFKVDSRFKLSLFVNKDGAAGGDPGTLDELDLNVLSQGALDQLALAARVAVLDRIAGSVQLPLLVDDAFLTWDNARRQSFREGLEELLPNRQIILVTHDADFLSWGKPIRHNHIQDS